MAKLGARSDCNKHIIKREHYASKDGEWKPNKKFEIEEDANAFIKKHKMSKYTSYVCKVCGKWHIGIRKWNYLRENENKYSYINIDD